jgi:hypothetical protein
VSRWQPDLPHVFDEVVGQEGDIAGALLEEIPAFQVAENISLAEDALVTVLAWLPASIGFREPIAVTGVDHRRHVVAWNDVEGRTLKLSPERDENEPLTVTGRRRLVLVFQPEPVARADAVFVCTAISRSLLGSCARTSVSGEFLIVTVASQPRRESSAAT